MNNKQIIANWTRRGLAILVTGLLSFGALQAKAEHYDLQDQLLVSGTQRSDPRQNDGMHFIRERSVGMSTLLGIFNESSICALSTSAGPNGLKTFVLTGQGVINCANGDQVFYRFQGTVTMSGATGIRNLFAQGVRCTVTVTGGTGQFAGAWGRGNMTSLVDSDGRFSTRSDITFSFPGEISPGEK